MKVPFALMNVIGGRVRSLVAMAGICFVLLLVFLQLGFLGGVIKTGTGIYDRLDFDIVIVSNNYMRFLTPDSFDSAYIYQAMSVTGVKSASRLYTRTSLWTNPDTGEKDASIAFGFNPKDPVFLLPEINKYLDKITKPDTVLYDKLSQKKCGDIHIGTKTEFSNRNIEVIGLYNLGAGFIADCTVITSDQNFARFFPERGLEHVNIGLVKIKQGFSVEDVVINLRKRFLGKVRVLTRDEMEAVQINIWVFGTNTGIVLGAGFAISIFIGVVILYQVLTNDITNRIFEFATLKAMGYSRWYLSFIVIQQAIILAVLGFIPSCVLSIMLYNIIRSATNIYIHMSVAKMCLVFFLGNLMCTISALLALRKVEHADPADLF